MAKYTSDIDYVQYALDISYDDRYYYAHSSDKFAFSCSTLVGHALYVCGYVKTDPKPADGHAIGGSVIDGYLREAGFKRYTWASIVNSGGMKPGDVLIVQPYHIAFHVRDGIMVAANGGGDMVDHRPEAITVYPYTAYGTPQYVWRPTKIHSATKTYSFNFPKVRYGNTKKDKNVRLMQVLLRGRGYIDKKTKKPIKVTGIWDDSTQRAFKYFCEKNSLKVVKYCSTKYWKKLLWR